MKVEKKGIVYVLINPAMPNIVKIGLTTREGIEQRMKELFTTGVPVPFECSYPVPVSVRLSATKRQTGGVVVSFERSGNLRPFATKRQLKTVENTEGVAKDRTYSSKASIK
jgi:T5orf172 domain